MANKTSTNKPMIVLVAVSDEKFGLLLANFITKHHWTKGTKFYILYVVDEVAIKTVLSLSPDMAQQAIYKDEVHGVKLTEEIAAYIHKTLVGIHTEGHILRGSAQEEILKIAKEIKADLIIVGSRGRTRMASLLLGSVSTHVIAHARCSVLVVRE